MDTKHKWITPFIKQCFVVTGASINMSQIGMVMGFAAVLLPQLKAPGAAITTDDNTRSWIASLPGIGLVLGNVTIPSLMSKFGRKTANIISIIIVILGWGSIIIANNLIVILIGRLLQGISAGMSSCLTPILIGEYTSPRNRGAFTILMSLIMAAGTFTVHTVGSFISWKTTALVCALISFIDLILILFSPDTPSWLADNGRYNECQKVFRWLRGMEEEEELAKMIEANKLYQEDQETKPKIQSFKAKWKGFFKTLANKEFFKPILLMMHVYTMGQWAGINYLAPYVVTLVDFTVGTENTNTAAVVISLGIQRMVSSVLAVFIIRKFKRRTMLFMTVGLNVLILLLSAGYIEAKEKNLIPNMPVLGGLLLHLLMMTVATGSLPLPFTIAGEIFPLRYRSLSGGISALFCSINIFLAVKTFPFIVNDIGLQGAYCVYSVIVVYCLVVVWFILPETKDRTLQEIEQEFRGKIEDEDLKSAEPLTTFKDVEL